MAVLSEPIQEPRVLENHIDGYWEPSEGPLRDVVNPAKLTVIGQVPLSTEAELDRAVQAAQAAFDDWRRTPPLARARCLLRLRDLMETHFEELSRIQTQEHGKTIDESRGETRRGIEMVEVAAGIPSLMMGTNLEDVAAGIDEFLIRQPLGVFGIIGPYNFPFMVPLWFAPFAVATGNCVVIKPSSEDPFSQVRVAELAEEAGIPPGVWNVVHGGREVVGAMLDHPDIVGICFVGSTPVAKGVVYPRCGATGKRVIAQGGAKNFALVMPDADLPHTIAACMTSFFGNAGQRCLANSNLVVVGEGLSEQELDERYQAIAEAFVAAARGITMGYGLDEAVQMGPLRDPGKKQGVVRHIEGALEQGATLLLDGREFNLLGDLPPDAFLGPTVLGDVTPDMAVAQQEVFGPVASLMRARSMDEAIAMIHANPFGNAASIFTNNGLWARKFRYEVRCGNIGINIGIAAPMAFFPFSGMKDSFLGVLHGQGEDVIRFFTESKIVIERWF
ncbi:MAG: CoA-acylating methylmalonate-semialdehyde dehydrogenase [Anaerolineae bacterium]|jgi:malonate-semialdehyde dehydrogenase (acetylating)/methylmalonate-semialdehyde dehydrogenase|nr:CoA-acylating methylmalonate-semialdehyde dehydrogenase [Chloroflexota bacterium]